MSFSTSTIDVFTGVGTTYPSVAHAFTRAFLLDSCNSVVCVICSLKAFWLPLWYIVWVSCFIYLYFDTWTGVEHDFLITWRCMSLHTNRVGNIIGAGPTYLPAATECICVCLCGTFDVFSLPLWYVQTVVMLFCHPVNYCSYLLL